MEEPVGLPEGSYISQGQTQEEGVTQPAETSTTQGTYPGGSHSIRAAFKLRGVPDPAVDTMIHSLADTTLKQYDGTFKLWWKFCQEKRVSPFSCTVPDTLSFFQYLLGNTNHLYGSFNSHRSALSLI
ncbi:unnamed protein product [Callosobruchus maculatus]|uniref:Uncharacterized protein n=1 Tax=Callosobruchus maculatus TaxID=64391 RepID=A0A653BDQ0_CALMS|nr:unnamed protein product [Callosobruchus maculatus]